MGAYERNAARNYDHFYEIKKYSQEVKFIDETTGGVFGKRILDVGCGTGTHAALLSDMHPSSILGIDTSAEMIEIASEKAKGKSNLGFVNVSLTDLHLTEKYDVVVSMFNVVNHIMTLREVSCFFEEISKRMVPHGHLIFDCWNGIAAIKDAPRTQCRQYEIPHIGHITTDTTPEINLIKSNVRMKTHVVVEKSGTMVDSYDYTLEHTLWTPKVFVDLIEENDMVIENIHGGNYELVHPATEDDYKIIFVCRKRRNNND